MCGIAGIFSPEGLVEKDLPKKMADAMIHRGPDDEGFYSDRNVGLAMRRLSVIDLPSGHQPMASDDGRVQLVFNGEIYNFQALRTELMAQGVRFKTQSDTEVILRLYERFGVDCVTRLRGMFAFAIWDEPKQRVMLARDRLGKKPLLYSYKSGRLVWASEMQSLLQVSGISKEIDSEAIDLYLGLQYVPSPWTVYKAVRKLPPAHVLLLEKGQLKIERYWHLPLEKTNLPTLTEAKQILRDKVTEAVKLRMVSDVPLGAFLSGGVDSTIVVGVMSQLSNRPIKTFAVGFEEEKFSELPYARQAAQVFKTDHTEFIVKPQMADILPKLARQYGEPFGDSSALPTYYLAQQTRKHVTVALTGDGGDENFGGYRRYIATKFLRFVGRRYFDSIGIFDEDEKEQLYAPGFSQSVETGQAAGYLKELFGQAKNLDYVNRMSFVDFSSYLPECLMTKVDIASMAHSLEARSPFLDHELIEFVFPLPGAWKLKGLSSTKWLLKEAFRDLLPPSILDRPKMGFGLPVDQWFRGELKNYWREHVLSSAALGRGYFNKAALEKLFEDHVAGRRNHGYRLWVLLMLELWNRSVT